MPVWTQVGRAAGGAFLAGLVGLPVRQAGRKLQHIAWATALLAIGSMFGGAGGILLITSLFFYLSGMPHFVSAGLISGCISILLGALAWVESFRLMRY